MPIVHIQSAADFSETAARVFQCLSVDAYRLGNSDHYPGGFYYEGAVGGFAVSVYPSDPDQPGFADFQFQVDLDIEDDASIDREEAVDSMVSELLAAGFPVTREIDRGDEFAVRERYALDPSGQLRKKEERVEFEKPTRTGKTPFRRS